MRVAAKPPVRCSGCFAQKIDEPHIDFESAWEGPQLDPENPRRGHVDWLVVCETCLRTAVGLLPDEAEETLSLTNRIAALEQRLAATTRYAEGLEEVLANRPADFVTPKVVPLPKRDDNVPAPPAKPEAEKPKSVEKPVTHQARRPAFIG